MNIDALLIADKLNLETAQIKWHELQTYFARGIVIYVAEELDLIAIAQALASDDSVYIASLMQNNQLGQVSDSQASGWYENNQTMWAVVVAPWVLIQAVALD